MGKAIYTGVSGVARTVKQPSVGVSNVARTVKNGYIGVGGVARQFWSGGELVLYDNGNAPYGVNTRACMGGSNRGVIGTNSLYIDTPYYLADTKGDTGIDNMIGCPCPFYIPNSAVRDKIDNLNSIKINVTISNLSKSQVYVTAGGYYGKYDTDDSGGYDYFPSSTWTQTFTANGTYEFTVSLTNNDKLYMKQYTNSDYYTRIYFGAYTNISSGSDYREWFCKARVDFNYIAFL